ILPPQLTQAEREEMQMQRFSRSLCAVAVLPTGRIVLFNAVRDPIAVVKDWADLHHHLAGAAHYGWHSVHNERWREVRREKAPSAKTDELALLALKIKIDL